MRLPEFTFFDTILHSFAMNTFSRTLALCFLILNCGGNPSSSTSSSTAAALLQETGADGCTVSGINNQLRAGFTAIDTTVKGVNFRLIQDTYYAVLQVKGASIGTVVVFNKDIKPTVYLSSNCPLNLDSDVLAKNTSEYTLTPSLNRTQISFNKGGSYLLYYYMKEVPETFGLTVYSGGTPVQTTGDSLSELLGTGTSSGTTGSTSTSSTNTFRFGCNNATLGACANYFLSTAGAASITTCSLGPTSSTKQTAQCTETGIVATCKQSVSGVGSVITLYSSPLTSSTASSLCPTSSGGTYTVGSTIPSP